MKERKIGLSLRYKLLILLTVLPVAVLSMYLFMATSLFEKDKLAYVYESSVSVASSLGTQVRLEVESFLESASPMLGHYDLSKRDFSDVAKDLFAKQVRVESLVVFQRNKSGVYEKLGVLQKSENYDKTFVNDPALMANVRAAAYYDEIVIKGFPVTGKHVVIGYRIGEAKDINHRIMISLLSAEGLLDAFEKSTLYKSFLFDKRGNVVLTPSDISDIGVTLGDAGSIFAPITDSGLPKGTVETQTAKGNKILVSYTDPRVAGMMIASVVDKGAALEAVDVLVAKSLLFFIALISATVIISVFASVKMTSTLRELYDATLKIAQGQFDVRVQSRSRDEVGGLADGFNWMAAEVSRLLTETVQKARMENELETVRAVQETLFPKSRNKFGPLDIVGHFEPASECGGDWWNYSKIGDKVWLWIGDATGHGAPAALITSAAKSASAIIETIPGLTPGKALEIMNRAIYATSKGQIMMTFFLASFDTKTGEVVYANASHDPPYLMRKLGRTLTKKDLIPLMDVNGPRLGDQQESVYEEASITMSRKDAILFYTDGIIDLQDEGGKMWGERKFIKTIIELASTIDDIDDRMELIRSRVQAFRGKSDLIDDITLFIAQYEDAA